jgi:glycosyltransferase involved in cell wall biosynthesis
MHVALWSPAWPLERYQNGIITYNHWMKRELEALGHRVTIFTEERFRYPGAEVVFAKIGLRQRVLRRLANAVRPVDHAVFEYSRVIAAAISAVHRRDPIDVIEMEESFGWFADIARRTSLPLLVKLHGPAFMTFTGVEAETPLTRERIEREGAALRTAVAIAAPAQQTLSRTVARYGLTPRLQQVVVNPMSMAADTPVWQLPQCERNTVLFVGRFDLTKGADILLRAISSLMASRPELRLIFVGPDEGISAASGERLKFAAYRDQLFAPEQRARVNFRGRVPHQEIAALRCAAMVTVVASRWENQPYSLLEAMLQGCPVVSTDAGGCPESVTHGVNGLLARSGDPEDFARQIEAMLNDGAAAAAMGAAAREHVARVHAPARVTAAMLGMYQQVIAAG